MGKLHSGLEGEGGALCWEAASLLQPHVIFSFVPPSQICV